MIILSDPSDLPSITNPVIRQWVAFRIQQLASSAPPATPCQFIVVEGGEAVSELESAAGYPILSSLFDDLPYTDPDFQPCSEILEVHHHEHQCIYELQRSYEHQCIYELQRIYEMVFISSDDGTATAIFIPDEPGVDSDLLAMCRSFATPAGDPAVSTP